MRIKLAIVATCALLLAACGARGAAPNEVTEKEKEQTAVHITVPSSYVKEDGLVDEWDNSLYTGVEVEEGQTIYYMTEEQQKDLIEDSQNNLAAMLEQVEKSTKYEAVTSIEQSNDFHAIRVNVDKKSYIKSDKEVLFQTIGLPLIHYQLLNGQDADSFVIECEVYDASADEMIEVVNLPMDLSNGVLK